MAHSKAMKHYKRQTEQEVIQQLVERSGGTVQFVTPESFVSPPTVRKTQLQRGRKKSSNSKAMESGSSDSVSPESDESDWPSASEEESAPHMEGGLNISREIASAISTSTRAYLAAKEVNRRFRHTWKEGTVIDLKSEHWEQTVDCTEEYELNDRGGRIHFSVGTWNGKHSKTYSLTPTDSLESVLEDYSSQDPARALGRTLSFAFNNKPVRGDDTPERLQLLHQSKIYATPDKITIVFNCEGENTTYQSVDVSSPLRDTMEHFWNEHVPPNSGEEISFLYNNAEIEGRDTPHSLGMDTNDTIQVIPEVLVKLCWMNPLEDRHESCHHYSLGVKDPLDYIFEVFNQENAENKGDKPKVCYRWGGRNLTGKETIASLGIDPTRGAKIGVYCLPLPPNFEDLADEISDEDGEEEFVDDNKSSQAVSKGENGNSSLGRSAHEDTSDSFAESEVTVETELGDDEQEAHSTNAKLKTQPHSKSKQQEKENRKQSDSTGDFELESDGHQSQGKDESEIAKMMETAPKKEKKDRDVFDFPSDNESQESRRTTFRTLSGKAIKRSEKEIEVVISYIRSGQKGYGQRQNQVVTKHKFKMSPHELLAETFKQFQMKETDSKKYTFLHQGRAVEATESLWELGLANCNMVELDAQSRAGFIKRRANCPPVNCRQQLDAPAREKLKGVRKPFETFLNMTTPYTRSDHFHKAPGVYTTREKDEESWPHNIHGIASILEMAPNKDGQNPSNNVQNRLQKRQVHLFVGSSMNCKKAEEFLTKGQFELVTHSTWESYMSKLQDSENVGDEARAADAKDYSEHQVAAQVTKRPTRSNFSPSRQSSRGTSQQKRHRSR